MNNPNGSSSSFSIDEDTDGLEFLEKGRHREAYRITSDRFGKRNRGRVLKFGVSEVGCRANQHEFETWMVVKSTNLRKYFCPIRNKSSDYSYIIMDFAETLEKFSDDVNEFIHGFSSDVTIDGIRLNNQGGTDINHSNLGRHEDLGVVLIDYPFGGLVLNRDELFG